MSICELENEVDASDFGLVEADPNMRSLLSSLQNSLPVYPPPLCSIDQPLSRFACLRC